MMGHGKLAVLPLRPTASLPYIYKVSLIFKSLVLGLVGYDNDQFMLERTKFNKFGFECKEKYTVQFYRIKGGGGLGRPPTDNF